MTSRSTVVFVGLFCLLTQVSPSAALGGDNAAPDESALGGGGCKVTHPDGYNGLLVFMATGSIPVADGFFLDGAIFQEQIMKRTPSQIAQNRADALAYFETRFGVADADANPDVIFFGFYVDPRIKYRAYVISGRRVPAEGYQVHDGGWIALVTNPNGLTLGGDFVGRHVPVNTIFSFGDYNIEVTKPGNGNKPPPIIIHFRCNNPLIPTFNGGEAFDCDLVSDEFGSGLAQGVNAPVFENGELKPNGRTVLTFSDQGGL
jgi:hypothetical protein